MTDEFWLRETFEKMPDAKERRRHALLQAASTIMSFAAIHGEREYDFEGAVHEAESMLRLIEKREAEERP